jgi:hypothetical protein
MRAGDEFARSHAGESSCLNRENVRAALLLLYVISHRRILLPCLASSIIQVINIRAKRRFSAPWDPGLEVAPIFRVPRLSRAHFLQFSLFLPFSPFLRPLPRTVTRLLHFITSLSSLEPLYSVIGVRCAFEIPALFWPFFYLIKFFRFRDSTGGKHESALPSSAAIISTIMTHFRAICSSFLSFLIFFSFYITI